MARIIKISQEEAKRRLGDVLGDKSFWCHDGKLVKNLRDLGKALNDMTDETFYYHLAEGRNDFSKWVREVVGDNRLAGELSKARSRMQAIKAVAQRISFLESRI